MEFLDKLTAQPEAAYIIFPVLWLLTIFLLRCLLSDLLKMHKSKSTIKKIEKQYTFRQKLCLYHVANHTEHAVKFTHFMIRVHHVSFCSMVICLASGAFLPEHLCEYMLLGRCVLLDVPVMLIDFMLDAHPFNKGKRRQNLKNRRRFSKYHNTSDKTSLF